jgi:hypothetical protein
MGTNDEPIRWHKVNGQCSVFVLVLLHWEAAFGGAMPCCDSAPARAGLRKVLDSSWSLVGEVNHMRAYHQTGCVLCFLK